MKRLLNFLKNEELNPSSVQRGDSDQGIIWSRSCHHFIHFVVQLKPCGWKMAAFLGIKSSVLCTSKFKLIFLFNLAKWGLQG
jgi:hypothetical protein